MVLWNTANLAGTPNARWEAVTIALEIERTLQKKETSGKVDMPYKAMLRRLQDELSQTSDKQERLQIESMMVVLLGILQLTTSIDKLVHALIKANKD